MTPARIETFLLAEIDTPEVRAALVRVLGEFEAAIEAATLDPVLKALELAAFAIVKARLAS